jgi:hypothetical protein
MRRTTWRNSQNFAPKSSKKRVEISRRGSSRCRASMLTSSDRSCKPLSNRSKCCGRTNRRREKLQGLRGRLCRARSAHRRRRHYSSPAANHSIHKCKCHSMFIHNMALRSLTINICSGPIPTGSGMDHMPLSMRRSKSLSKYRSRKFRKHHLHQKNLSKLCPRLLNLAVRKILRKSQSR